MLRGVTEGGHQAFGVWASQHHFLWNRTIPFLASYQRIPTRQGLEEKWVGHGRRWKDDMQEKVDALPQFR